MSRNQNLVNRRNLVQSAAFAAAILPTAKSFAQDATPDTSPVDGEWTFTDDKGVTVTLPTRPERLVIDVNAAAPLWDFGIKPTALFGWNVRADGTLGDAGGNVEPEGIPTVGNVNEPIILEDLVAVDPELIITITHDLEDPTNYWSIESALQDQVNAIAPVVAISATGMADVNTERFAELARLLGADLESDELAEARQAYQDSLATFETVMAEKSDLDVLFVAPGQDAAWIASYPAWDALSLYASLGMNIVEPESPDGYWEQISYEQALRYPSDVLFSSTRPTSLTIDEMKASPTFGEHPAIQADQIFGWNQDFIRSYQGMAETLSHIAEAVSASEKVT